MFKPTEIEKYDKYLFSNKEWVKKEEWFKFYKNRIKFKNENSSIRKELLNIYYKKYKNKIYNKNFELIYTIYEIIKKDKNKKLYLKYMVNIFCKDLHWKRVDAIIMAKQILKRVARV